MSLKKILEAGSPGRRLGAMQIEWSDNRHAYGLIPVPVAVVTGCPGPTVLLVAGTHGDEYEGQLVLQRLIRQVQPDELSGRLIILPALNLPAVLAAERVSPIDGLNLNRAYPGCPDGTPTRQIAHVVAEELLPVSEYALDLHSGGSTAVYLPSAYVYEGPSPERFHNKRKAAETLGMPWSIKVTPQNGTRTLSGLAEDMGLCAISTEIAGGGMVTPELTEQLFVGLMRLLHSWGVMKACGAWAGVSPTRWVQMRPGSTVYAAARGLFEARESLRLGNTVSAGDCVGRIYSVDDIHSQPTMVISPRSGIVGIIRRSPMVEPGDGLFSLMDEITDEKYGELP